VLSFTDVGISTKMLITKDSYIKPALVQVSSIKYIDYIGYYGIKKYSE
jgi:hypothetical protein